MVEVLWRESGDDVLGCKCLARLESDLQSQCEFRQEGGGGGGQDW